MFKTDSFLGNKKLNSEATWKKATKCNKKIFYVQWVLT